MLMIQASVALVSNSQASAPPPGPCFQKSLSTPWDWDARNLRFLFRLATNCRSHGSQYH